jgi:putative DNA primase/helicase
MTKCGNLQNIPDQLRRKQAWVIWRYEKRNGKKTKVPIDAKTGGPASSTDHSTWCSFAAACQTKHTANGIGFVFSGDGIMGVDLDHCVDPQTGAIEPWALEIKNKLNSYTEITPSGTGLHIIFQGKIPPSGGKRKDRFESYQTDRFFTITGHHLKETPLTIEERQSEFAEIHEQVFGKPQFVAKKNGSRPPASLQMGDEEVLTLARNDQKFRILYDAGDIAGYPSHSEADAALCNKLAFYTGRNESQMDRLFRTSALFREKWDSKRGGSTWGTNEIRAACERQREIYSPERSSLPILGATLKPEQSPKPAVQNDSGLTGNGQKPDLLQFMNNDSGNSDRIIALSGQDLRFCHPLRNWLVWDGRRWDVDTNKQAHRLAKKAMLAYMAQAVEAGSEAHEKFAKQSLDAKRIKAALEMAQCEIFVDPVELDAEPYLLNFENGMVDLRTGELMPHDRQRMITKLVKHACRAEAKCPRFISFLYRIMGTEADEDRAERLVKYLQKAVGYSLTAITKEKAVFILWGSGDNGKTTLLGTLRNLLGEYAGLLQIETIMARRDESNNSQADLADLRGRRFIMTSETEENQRLSESKLKRITQGMGSIKAARKYENPIEFTETHKMWIDANHKPVIRGTDNAIWNRLHLIPFTVSIPKAEQERGLGDRFIAEEAEGILAWAVRGAVTWYKDQLGKPPDIEKAGEEWRAESDSFKDFLEDCCIIKPGAGCTSPDLWKRYGSSAEANGGVRLLTRTRFAERLLALGCKKGRTSTARTWEGIGLLPE